MISNKGMKNLLDFKEVEIKGYKQDIDRHREYIERLKAYYESAKIVEKKEIRIISDNGKITWLPYLEGSEDVILIDGMEYLKRNYEDHKIKTKQVIEYSGSFPKLNWEPRLWV